MGCFYFIHHIVDKEHLIQGNSVINLINSVAGMAGPVIGGIVFSQVGLTPILYISMACFLASAVMELFIHIPFEKKKEGKNIFVTGFHDLQDSFRFMFQTQPVLCKVSFIYGAVNMCLVSLILIGLPVLITQHMGFAGDTANRLYGYAQGVLAAGAILGGFAAGVRAKKLKSTACPFFLIGCGLSVFAGGMAVRNLNSPMAVYTVLLAGSGLLIAFSTMFQIQIMSYIQILTPRGLTGKVIACVMCICMCANPLGQFIYGFVFEQAGSHIHLPFYMAGCTVAVLGFLTRRFFTGIAFSLKRVEPAFRI